MKLNVEIEISKEPEEKNNREVRRILELSSGRETYTKIGRTQQKNYNERKIHNGNSTKDNRSLDNNQSDISIVTDKESDLSMDSKEAEISLADSAKGVVDMINKDDKLIVSVSQSTVREKLNPVQKTLTNKIRKDM